MVVCREGVSHQCCTGWLQGLSFFVVCWEVRGIGAVVDVGGVSFFAVCREGIGE